MGVLDFIFGIIIAFMIFISVIGGLSIKFDNDKLQKENGELKEKLRKRETRKLNKTKKEDK